MDQKKLVEVIKQLTGRNITVSSMYEKINTWRNWLTGEVDGFYEYTMSVDLVNKRTAKMKRHRTDMFKRACEDWASLLLNELTRFEMDEKVSEAWLQGDDGNGGILGDNDFRRNANELIMVSRWAGTAAFEAYVEGGTTIAESGQLLSGKDIGINFLSADQIIPISHRNGIMKEVAFVSEKSIGDGKKNYDVSMHLLEGDLYTIFYFTIDENGKVIDAPAIVRTGSPIPWFSVIRKAGYNHYDPMGPFGVGILDGNEDVLKGLDTAFDNFVVDFTLGRKMVFMNSTLFTQDAEGRFIAPQMMGDSLFINIGDSVEKGKLLEEYNPQLRVDENANGVQRMLDIFSFKIGLGKGYYRLDEDGMVKTATEYTGSKQGLIRNVAREMIGVEAALKQLIQAVLWIGENVLHVTGVKYDADVRVIADDSYITDEYTERKVWQEEVAQGLRSKQEYRERFMGESDTEAAKVIQAIREETPILSNLLDEPTE